MHQDIIQLSMILCIVHVYLKLLNDLKIWIRDSVRSWWTFPSVYSYHSNLHVLSHKFYQPNKHSTNLHDLLGVLPSYFVAYCQNLSIYQKYGILKIDLVTTFIDVLLLLYARSIKFVPKCSILLKLVLKLIKTCYLELRP